MYAEKCADEYTLVKIKLYLQPIPKRVSCNYYAHIT